MSGIGSFLDLYTSFERASRTGLPTLAPPLFYFPADENLWNDDSVFMVGDSILVAPALWQGLTARPVYLPAGVDWYDAYSDVRYPGGTFREMQAPLSRPPVFIRAPAIIPKGPVVQYTNERQLTDLRVHLYPASGAFETAFTLYEDDGQTFDYQKGAFLRTRIGYEGTGSIERVAIERVEGAMEPPLGRTWTIELRGVGSTDAVMLNGATLPTAPSLSALESMAAGWTISHQRVVVRVPDSSTRILVEATHGWQQ